VSVQQRGRVWILVLLFFVLVTEPMITWASRRAMMRRAWVMARRR
jgi:hypothetical protein